MANKVVLLESPAMPRSIYYYTELEQEIPVGLYLAVAQALAYPDFVRVMDLKVSKRMFSNVFCSFE